MVAKNKSEEFNLSEAAVLVDRSVELTKDCPMVHPDTYEVARFSDGKPIVRNRRGEAARVIGLTTINGCVQLQVGFFDEESKYIDIWEVGKSDYNEFFA